MRNNQAYRNLPAGWQTGNKESNSKDSKGAEQKHKKNPGEQTDRQIDREILNEGKHRS